MNRRHGQRTVDAEVRNGVLRRSPGAASADLGRGVERLKHVLEDLPVQSGVIEAAILDGGHRPGMSRCGCSRRRGRCQACRSRPPPRRSGRAPSWSCGAMSGRQAARGVLAAGAAHQGADVALGVRASAATSRSLDDGGVRDERSFLGVSTASPSKMAMPTSFSSDAALAEAVVDEDRVRLDDVVGLLLYLGGARSHRGRRGGNASRWRRDRPHAGL